MANRTPTTLLADIAVPSHIKFTLPSGLQLVPLSHMETEAYQDNPDNKALLVAAFELKHASKKDRQSLPYNSTNTGQYRAAATRRIIGEKPYDRIINCMDMISGRMGSLVLTSGTDTKRTFRRCLYSEEGVGSFFLLIEIDPITQYLGDNSSVAVIENPTVLIPVVGDSNKLLPTLPLQVPERNHTVAFCLHKVATVKLTRVTLVKGCCGGRLCDKRSDSLLAHQACGCIFTSSVKGADIVMDTDVQLKVDSSFSKSEKITVRHFRSLKTTSVFVPEDQRTKVEPDEVTDKIRTCAKQCTDMINANGGWNIAGWIRSGTVKDASDSTGNEVIQSMAPTIHISYMYPSDPSILTKDEFKALQLTLHD